MYVPVDFYMKAATLKWPFENDVSVLALLNSSLHTSHMKQFLLCPLISANDAALSLPVKGADASAVANHKRVLTVFPQTSLLSCSCIIKAYPSHKEMV